MEAVSGAVGTVCEAVDLSVGVSTTPQSDTKAAVVRSTPKEEILAGQNSMPRIADPHQVPLPHSPRLQPKQETQKTFAVIRPPGHHCSDETPSGFCFVNNVLIGVAHGELAGYLRSRLLTNDAHANLPAHLAHKVTRAIIFDIDLHHGNGTQAITWSINAETMRQEEESMACLTSGQAAPPSGLKVYYSSIHDILSFPCEVRDFPPSPCLAHSRSF
jgi:histone deacetylase HOS3